MDKFSTYPVDKHFLIFHIVFSINFINVIVVFEKIRIFSRYFIAR
jgi:hypothetical protein